MARGGEQRGHDRADVAVVAGDEDLHGRGRRHAVDDQPGERQARRRGGRGRVADVQRVGALGEDEVVDQAAVAAERLRADPGGAGEDVVAAQLGDVAGGVGDERAAADGVAQLLQAGAPPAPRHPVGAGPAQGVAQVGGADPAQRVGVAGAGEQRGRADEHLVVGPAREVDAEERERRVGHGVDERPARGPGARGAGAARRRGRGRCAGRARHRRRPRAGPTTRPRRRPRSAPATPRPRGAGGCRVGCGSTASTPQPVTTSPPAARTSSAKARAIAWKSTTAV